MVCTIATDFFFFLFAIIKPLVHIVEMLGAMESASLPKQIVIFGKKKSQGKCMVDKQNGASLVSKICLSFSIIAACEMAEYNRFEMHVLVGLCQ